MWDTLEFRNMIKKENDDILECRLSSLKWWAKMGDYLSQEKIEYIERELTSRRIGAYI
jgi:hypothetical protein